MATAAQRARSFGAIAARYDEVRPSYPPAALESVLPEDARLAADVGAGTGKLTSLLVAEGLEVIAVEPDAKMRAVLAERISVDIRQGTAEQLPIGDSEVDAVVFGQSWHWVDETKAASEAARVLRESGVLGLFWNMSDDSIDWVESLREITYSNAQISEFTAPKPLAGFCPGHRADVAWEHRLGRSELVDLVSTWSSVSTLPGRKRQAVLNKVSALLDEHPALRGQEIVALPQICVALSYHVL